MICARTTIQKSLRECTVKNNEGQIVGPAMGIQCWDTNIGYTNGLKDEVKNTDSIFKIKTTGGPFESPKTLLGGPCRDTRKNTIQKVATPLLDYNPTESLSPTPYEFDMGKDNEPPDINNDEGNDAYDNRHITVSSDVDDVIISPDVDDDRTYISIFTMNSDLDFDREPVIDHI